MQIDLVRGNEGYCLNLVNDSGGYRLSGPKPWGNPYNIPELSFNLDMDSIRVIFKECNKILESEENKK